MLLLAVCGSSSGGGGGGGAVVVFVFQDCRGTPPARLQPWPSSVGVVPFRLRCCC